MRTTARISLLGLSLAFAAPAILAQHPKPQHPESQADSTKTRKAFLKHEKKVQKKMNKQRKASLKAYNKAHPASHPPATNHKSEETH